jgi:hypothetical protein
MKKLILGVALASLVISCKKVQAGGNIGVLKMEEGTDRYSEEEMKDEKVEAEKSPAKSDSAIASTDTAKVSGMQVAPAKMKSV